MGCRVLAGEHWCTLMQCHFSPHSASHTDWPEVERGLSGEKPAINCCTVAQALNTIAEFVLLEWKVLRRQFRKFWVSLNILLLWISPPRIEVREDAADNLVCWMIWATAAVCSIQNILIYKYSHTYVFFIIVFVSSWFPSFCDWSIMIPFVLHVFCRDSCRSAPSPSWFLSFCTCFVVIHAVLHLLFRVSSGLAPSPL